MIELDLTRCKIKPFEHQRQGIKALLRHSAFALFDEPGAGKSAQVINAACTLAAAGVIDTVVVVAPASVRCVWIDEELGEITKHAWLPSIVTEFHEKHRVIWHNDKADERRLVWRVTNYEFLRSSVRLEEFIKYINKRTLLVLDEASYIKTRTAQRTKAIAKLRALCDRCVILNGTPVTDSPLDLWAQMKVLDENILGEHYRNFWHFRADYAIMGGFKMKQVKKYVNLDKLSEIVAPYVLRRLKKDCLDLPEKLYTQRAVELDAASWARYRELKRDAIIALEGGDLRLEPNAAVRVMRLAQLTSGILGKSVVEESPITGALENAEFMTDLSSEKLDWAVQYLLEECAARAVIVWCRWIRERERLVKALVCDERNTGDNKIEVYELCGSQSKGARDEAVQQFTRPPAATDARSVLVAQPHAGGHGLNLVAATEAIYLSNDFSLGIRLQSEDRCHRPGQQFNVTYIDVLATGPKGQKTIDHAIVKALREKQTIAEWTTSRWKKELGDEG